MNVEESKQILEGLASGSAYNGWMAEKAQFALDATKKFEIGKITEDEYKELMEDLARLEDIEEEADNLEMKTALVTAIYGIAQIA